MQTNDPSERTSPGDEADTAGQTPRPTREFPGPRPGETREEYVGRKEICLPSDLRPPPIRPRDGLTSGPDLSKGREPPPEALEAFKASLRPGPTHHTTEGYGEVIYPGPPLADPLPGTPEERKEALELHQRNTAAKGLTVGHSERTVDPEPTNAPLLDALKAGPHQQLKQIDNAEAGFDYPGPPVERPITTPHLPYLGAGRSDATGHILEELGQLRHKIGKLSEAMTIMNSRLTDADPRPREATLRRISKRLDELQAPFDIKEEIQAMDSSVDAQLVELSRALEKRDAVVLERLSGLRDRVDHHLAVYLEPEGEDEDGPTLFGLGEQIGHLRAGLGEVKLEVRSLHQEHREHAQGDKPGYREPLPTDDVSRVTDPPWDETTVRRLTRQHHSRIEAMRNDMEDLIARVSELEGA